MDYTHLHDEIYYVDLYDRLTVEHCRRHEKAGQHIPSSKPKKEMTDAEKEEEIKKAWGKVVSDMMLHGICGEDYLSKRDTIRQWMERDRLKDLKVKNAQEPRGVHCLNCGGFMHVEMRDLNELGGTERVMFLFRCDAGCKRGRTIFEGGQEYIRKPDLCQKCSSIMNSVDERKEDVITTTYTCPSCQHSYQDTLDLKVEKQKPDPDFEKDRQRFCFDEKRGSEYFDFKMKMNHLSEVFAEDKKKQDNKELYDAVAKIKKLPFGEVQKLLTPVLEEDGYGSLQFQPPQIDKTVTVSFTAVDSKTGRVEYDSLHNLKKLLNKTLEGTNWRLVQSSIDYRLGFLSGRLQGLEREEDLINIVQKNLNAHEKTE